MVVFWRTSATLGLGPRTGWRNQKVDGHKAGAMECLSPNIHVPDLSAGPGPRKKRFQVHSACSQCKKSHAACSMTRPCERCVRVGEAHLCVDLPRKRRGKQANQPLSVNSVTLEPPPAIPSIPDDGLAPIDEISDFLFDGLENHLLADNTLRNVSLMEASALNANTLLHSRPLFGTNSQFGLPTTTSSPSHSSSGSSGTPSPVPTSPYSPNGNLSPPYMQPPNAYYIPDNATVYNILTSDNLTTNTSNYLQSNISPDNFPNISPNNDLYTTTTQEYHPTDEALINAHITNLINNHTQPPKLVSPPTTTSIWTDPAFPATLTQDDDSSQALTTTTSKGNHSSHIGHSCSKEGLTPSHERDPLSRLMGMDATGVPGGGVCPLIGECSMPQCFCNKINPGNKVQVVCAADSKECIDDSCLVQSAKPSPNNSLHLVVESLLREVQTLKREMRDGDKEASGPKIGKPGYAASGPAVAVWDLVEQRLLECNETFASLFCVDPSKPLFLADVAQCPAYMLRLCAVNSTSWHEKRKYSLKRPEGDLNLVIAIDINGTCVVTTVWKAE